MSSYPYSQTHVKIDSVGHLPINQFLGLSINLPSIYQFVILPRHNSLLDTTHSRGVQRVHSWAET